MTYGVQVEKMTPRHFKIMDLCISGLTNAQIATELSMNRVQVGIVISSPSFQHQFAIRRSKLEAKQDMTEIDKVDDVKAVLKRSAKDAADRLISGISSTDEKIALKSATELLDRTGYPKEQKISSDAPTTQILISSVELNNLKESLNMDSRTVDTNEADLNPGSEL